MTLREAVHDAGWFREAKKAHAEAQALKEEVTFLRAVTEAARRHFHARREQNRIHAEMRGLWSRSADMATFKADLNTLIAEREIARVEANAALAELEHAVDALNQAESVQALDVVLTRPAQDGPSSY